MRDNPFKNCVVYCVSSRSLWNNRETRTCFPVINPDGHARHQVISTSLSLLGTRTPQWMYTHAIGQKSCRLLHWGKKILCEHILSLKIMVRFVFCILWHLCQFSYKYIQNKALQDITKSLNSSDSSELPQYQDCRVCWTQQVIHYSSRFFYPCIITYNTQVIISVC